MAWQAPTIWARTKLTFEKLNANFSYLTNQLSNYINNVTNVITAAGGFIGIVTGNASSATNVTTNINGHAVTDIFEADGATVKKATIAATATNAEKLGGYTYSQVKQQFDNNAKFVNEGTYFAPGLAYPVLGVLINKSTGAISGLSTLPSYKVPEGYVLIYWF